MIYNKIHHRNKWPMKIKNDKYKGSEYFEWDMNALWIN